MNVHLMFREREFVPERYPPVHARTVVRDLELRPVLEIMANGDENLYRVAEQVLPVGLEGVDEIRYRQRVLEDCVANPDIVRELYSVAMEATSFWRGRTAPHSDGLAGTVRRSVEELAVFSTLLKRLRTLACERKTVFVSEGFCELFGMFRTLLDDELFAAIDGHLRQLARENSFHFSVGLGPGNRGVDYALQPPPRRSGWNVALGRLAGRGLAFELDPMNERARQELIELQDRGLAHVARALDGAGKTIAGLFRHLATETGFYLACLNLHDRLLEIGAPICWPDVASGDGPMLTYRGLYDVSLVIRSQQRAIGNAATAHGKTLVMITGANSGGKSTLLRALGSAHVMMQSGMFVCAESFRASTVRGIFTHFIREEDATMTSGKLDEELARMSALAEQLTPRCLVLFNESFAATNEAEGSEIAHEIVAALLENGVRVFFVTHQFVLAELLQKEQGRSALFLRAERDASGHPTFRFFEGEPLPTSFGTEVYRRLGGW